MAKLSFVSEETTRIDLEEGTWVEIRKEMSYDEYMDALGEYQKDAPQSQNGKVAMRLLEKCIKSWSDTAHECTPENIRKLSLPVVLAITEKVMAALSPEKKSLQS